MVIKPDMGATPIAIISRYRRVWVVTDTRVTNWSDGGRDMRNAVIESNKGNYAVFMYDGSMGYTAKCTVISGVTKAIANSVVRHMCKVTPWWVDISYYAEEVN